MTTRDEYDVAAAHLMDRQLTTNPSLFSSHHPYLHDDDNAYLPTSPLDQLQLDDDDNNHNSDDDNNTNDVDPVHPLPSAGPVTAMGVYPAHGGDPVAGGRAYPMKGKEEAMMGSSSSTATSLAAFASDMSASFDMPSDNNDGSNNGNANSNYLHGGSSSGGGIVRGGTHGGSSSYEDVYASGGYGGYDQERAINEQIGPEFHKLQQTIDMMQGDVANLQALVRKVQRNEGVGMQAGTDAAEQCRVWAAQMQDFLMVDGMPEVLLGTCRATIVSPSRMQM